MYTVLDNIKIYELYETKRDEIYYIIPSEENFYIGQCLPSHHRGNENNFVF